MLYDFVLFTEVNSAYGTCLTQVAYSPSNLADSNVYLHIAALFLLDAQPCQPWHCSPVQIPQLPDILRGGDIIALIHIRVSTRWKHVCSCLGSTPNRIQSSKYSLNRRRKIYRNVTPTSLHLSVVRPVVLPDSPPASHSPTRQALALPKQRICRLVGGPGHNTRTSWELGQ